MSQPPDAHRQCERYKRIVIPRTVIEFNAAHFYRGGTSHGPATEPQNWPWWKVFHLSRVVTSGNIPGHRLWMYTRWGALHADWTVYPDD